MSKLIAQAHLVLRTISTLKILSKYNSYILNTLLSKTIVEVKN
jgi:hypothetical protein